MGWLDVFDSATINNTASGSDDTITVIGQSAAFIAGDVTANGDEGSVVNVAENSRVNINGDIDGSGVIDAVQCQNASAMKMAGSTLTNLTVGVRCTRNSFANLKDTVTYNNAAAYVRDNTGHVYDEAASRGTTEDAFFIGNYDLSTASAPAPEGSVPCLAMHTGTDPGLYRSDKGNSQWVKIEDNTVTISY